MRGICIGSYKDLAKLPADRPKVHDAIIAARGHGARASVMLTLATCPWCGNAPAFQKWHGGGPAKILISCRDDKCHVNPSVTGETPKQAANRWGNRAGGYRTVTVFEDADGTEIYEARQAVGLNGSLGIRERKLVAAKLPTMKEIASPFLGTVGAYPYATPAAKKTTTKRKAK